MNSIYQRGALSLLWTTVVMLIVVGAGACALMSMRLERNLFAEAWEKVAAKAGPIAPVLEQPKQAVRQAAQTESSAIRKCVINGRVTYSNVECDAQNPTSRKVDVQVSGGFEAPKAPPAPAPAQKSASEMQLMAIDRATGK